MGSLTLVLSAFAFLLVSGYTNADRQCPPPSKVYSRDKCRENYDCKFGKLCCKNQSNEKSCAEPVYNGGTGSDKYPNAGNGGVLCDGVKCQPGQVCQFNKNTKRKECVRG